MSLPGPVVLTPAAGASSRKPLIRALIAAAVAAVLVIAASAFVLIRSQASTLAGTDLGATPAPNFQLVDQDGQQVSLQQFRGKPVVLTFLYTHCPDACPLIADQVHVALARMGPDAAQVGVLAVSTDPVGDNRQDAASFVQTHNLNGQMHYLLGSPAELQPIWKNYFIGVTPAAAGQSEVDHSEAVFVIDKSGAERVLLGVPFRAEDLAADLEKLLKS